MSAKRRGVQVSYGRTGEKKETLAKQAAIRLLRGESWVAVESSLQARGVDNTDEIMRLAEIYVAR